jgi:hypothetical protein
MFTKHIGKHGDRKVAVVFKEVPDEDHMSLVIYTEVLQSAMHDAIMKIIESPPGQEAKDLGDVLFRNLFSDGRPMLETLHKEGMIKKVPSSQILMTPNASSHIRLDELNKILKEMSQGEEALKKLVELDNASGLVDPALKRAAEAAFKEKSAMKNVNVPSPEVLGDVELAKNLRNQAVRMKAEAEGMLQESARLLKEAESLDGIPVAAKRTKTSKKVQPAHVSQ